MTEIKTSLITNAGSGVFATRKYKKGACICYYDGEYNDTKEDQEYAMINPYSKKNLIGYKIPRTKNGVGQIINDYCRVKLPDQIMTVSLFLQITTKILTEYTENSIKNANVTFYPGEKNLFKLYAKRDIFAGEELYLHYGVNYWLSNIFNNSIQPLIRLYCLLKTDVLRIKKEIIYLNNNAFDPENFLWLLGMDPNGKMIAENNLTELSNIQKIKYFISLF